MQHPSPASGHWPQRLFNSRRWREVALVVGLLSAFGGNLSAQSPPPRLEGVWTLEGDPDNRTLTLVQDGAQLTGKALRPDQSLSFEVTGSIAEGGSIKLTVFFDRSEASSDPNITDALWATAVESRADSSHPNALKASMEATYEAAADALSGERTVPVIEHHGDKFDKVSDNTIKFRLTRTQEYTAGFSFADTTVPMTEAIPLQFLRVTAKPKNAGLDTSGIKLTATVKNARTGKSTDVELKQDPDNKNLLASLPVLLAVPGADPNAGFSEIAACPGDSIKVTIKGATATLQVATPADILDRVPCKAPPPPPVVRLRATTPTDLSFDAVATATHEGKGIFGDFRGTQMPLGPRVALTHGQGQPLADEALVWSFAERGEAFVTYTNSQGASALDFQIVDRGNFMPLIDGALTGSPIPDGKLTIVVAPRDPVYAALLDHGPVQFTVDLVSPTALDFIDKQGYRISSVVSGEALWVRAWLGRSDKQAARGKRSIDVRIDPPIALIKPVTVQAPRRGSDRVYETNTSNSAPFSVRTKASISGAFQPGLLVDDGDLVTGSYGMAQAHVSVYGTAVRQAEAQLRDAFNLLSDSLRTQASKEARIRRQLVQNALAWLDDADMKIEFRVAVAQRYVSLIQADPDQLGEPFASPRTAKLSVGASHAFASQAELDQATAALNEAQRADPERLVNKLVAFGKGAGHLIVSLPEILIVDPALGGYTAVTGLNAEGEVATTYQRVMGGADAIISVVGAVSAVKGLAKMATALKGLVARALIAEGKTVIEVTIAEAVAIEAASVELTATKEVVAEVLQAAGPVTGEASTSAATEAASAATDATSSATAATAAAPAKAGKMARLLETIERRQGYMIDRASDIVDAEAKATELEAKIADLKQAQASASTTKKAEGIAEKIANAEKKIADIRNRRIPDLQRRLDGHRKVWEDANRALARLEGRSLTEAELKSMLAQKKFPGPFDLVNGTVANKQYENQITRMLKAQNKNWEAGVGIEIPSAYESPLGEGFGGTVKNDFSNVRKGVRRPTPDHFNPQTAAAADSKYYDFANMAKDNYAKAAKEIADTVEKARIVQATKIAGGVAETRLHDTLEFAESWTKEMTIYTPTDAPSEVQQLVRELVGPRTGGDTLKFATIAPDPISWLAH